ncbi:MAG TPA: SCO family protein [Flavobacteriales bacterium]|nr:SCO family protein [Flavobacteriales bacterium]HQX30753.1 SCO family protein [Flavobacteriales bacterium]HQX39112.1 SCO family protein [Flavobacteriales bacterium]HQZ43740.1 SCO family protein [Flavobacteriales bacterium]HQZ93410.1 SCO family protein [Flavobacteriales bacterium]
MEHQTNRSIGVRILLFLAVAAVAIIVGWQILKPSDVLPIYHPSQLDPRLVADDVKGRTGEHHISDFKLIDQHGAIVEFSDVKDNIIVADFFFTTCATICPKMTTQMGRVQAAFPKETPLMLLSHSVTPEMDSVPVLASYAELYKADYDRWRFLTGDRKQIYDLARGSYFAAVDEGDGGPDDFVHTENFVLVDPQRRIRGFYDGTKTVDVDRLIGDIEKLLDEVKDPLPEK